jgi:hypothetical protein
MKGQQLKCGWESGKFGASVLASCFSFPMSMYPHTVSARVSSLFRSRLWSEESEIALGALGELVLH